MHDRNHEPDFCDRISNEKNSRIKFNVVCNNFLDISGQNFVKRIFMAINLSKKKYLPLFEAFHLVKTALFVSIKESLLIAELNIMLKLTRLKKFWT